VSRFVIDLLMPPINPIITAAIDQRRRQRIRVGLIDLHEIAGRQPAGIGRKQPESIEHPNRAAAVGGDRDRHIVLRIGEGCRQLNDRRALYIQQLINIILRWVAGPNDKVNPICHHARRQRGPGEDYSVAGVKSECVAVDGKGARRGFGAGAAFAARSADAVSVGFRLLGDEMILWQAKAAADGRRLHGLIAMIGLGVEVGEVELGGGRKAHSIVGLREIVGDAKRRIVAPAGRAIAIVDDFFVAHGRRYHRHRREKILIISEVNGDVAAPGQAMIAGPCPIAPLNQIRVGGLARRAKVFPDMHIVAPLAERVAARVKLDLDIAEIDFFDGVALMAGEDNGAHKRRILTDDRIAGRMNIDPRAADPRPAIDNFPRHQRLLDGCGLRLHARFGLILTAEGLR
jgi:hypothetical protein